MDSIIQTDRDHCFLCGMNRNLEPLERHHVFFGTANRKKSEKYGLTVYIHGNKCHRNGKESVHRNAEVDKTLKEMVQKRAMQYYGWSVEDFISIFGKNYL